MDMSIVIVQLVLEENFASIYRRSIYEEGNNSLFIISQERTLKFSKLNSYFAFKLFNISVFLIYRFFSVRHTLVTRSYRFCLFRFST